MTKDSRTSKRFHEKGQTLEIVLRDVMKPSYDALVVIDEKAKIKEVNPATEQMFGWRRRELLGQSMEMLIPRRHLRAFRQRLIQCLRQGSMAKFQKPRKLEGRNRNGIEFPIEINISKFKTGARWSLIVFIRDMTERQRLEKALAEQAIRDSLTDLYNRRYFNERIQEEIARADRSVTSLGILLCDLDRFKAINEAKGHLVGDRILKAVGKGIQECTRGTDSVFRWGGDKYAVILSDTNRDGILIASERIRNGIHKIGRQNQLDLDVSIGVALYPEHGATAEEITRVADRALYIAKRGGDKIHIGEEEYHLDEHSIKVVFQPVVDVRSNQVLGYEALSRDARGRLSILELFKKYQAIGQLHELKSICFRAQIKTAQKIGLKRVFINVDFNVLGQPEMIPKPPGMEVVLEISELEAIHDIEKHLEITQKWREQGYKFAIDDFGAGFVSLPFIAHLIPDYIKVDRSTILQAVSYEKFRRFLKDLLLALRNYSSEGIIAEGIETERELQIAKEIEISLVQGFFLGKPQELKRSGDSREPFLGAFSR